MKSTILFFFIVITSFSISSKAQQLSSMGFSFNTKELQAIPISTKQQQEIINMLNFSRQVEALESNVAYIKLEKIPFIEQAKATLDAAMCLLIHKDAKVKKINKMRASPKKKSQTNSPQSELLGKMLGEWVIHARMRMNPATDDFKDMKGKASFEQLYTSEQIKESFELAGRFKGEAFINYAATHERYELFQIDMMSSRRSTILLNGEYDEETQRLNFKHLDNYPQWGKSPSLQLRWEYIFYPDGSFKKEMYSKDEAGNYYLQSDYHYKKE